MTQRSYVEQEIKKNTKDTGNMWKVIRTCIPKKSTEKKCFSSDDESVANNFNQFFTSIGSNTVTKIKSLAKENNYTPSQLPFIPHSYPESEQFTFEPVECSLVEYIVKSMPDNKSPGIDKNTNPCYQGLFTRHFTMDHFHHKQLAGEQYISEYLENRGSNSHSETRRS